MERSSKKRGGPTSRVSTREPFESGDLEALLAVLVQLKTLTKVDLATSCGLHDLFGDLVIGGLWIITLPTLGR